ncbi:MAG: ATP-binding protein [Eubacteriales bacterium]|nr:ATP-binding protein [Eubacteriales bacterium]MDD3082544.1 ATP-binding protein [Desulfobacterales bacterium]
MLQKQLDEANHVISELRLALAAAHAKMDRSHAELQQKTEELVASEGRFKNLVRTIPDIVYQVDCSGHFVWVNPAVQKLGYAPEDLIGRHFSEIIHPEDVPAVSRAVVLPQHGGRATGEKDAPKLFDERRAGDRGTQGLEIRMMCKASDRVEYGRMSDFGQGVAMVEISSAGIYQTNAYTERCIHAGTVGVIRDVSDCKSMGNALEESRRRLQIILDHTDAGIMLIDARTHVIADVNPAAEKMINASRKDLIGRQCHQYVCPQEVGQCPITDFGQAVDNRECVLVQAGKSEIPILKTVALVELENQPYLLESFLDISALKHAETELENARKDLGTKVAQRTAELVQFNEQLQGEIVVRERANVELEKVLEDMKRSQGRIVQTEKMSALGTLTAGVAHELNNPMMGILNYIQYCLRKTDSDDRRFEVLKDAEREVGRCINIVGNLLTFSRQSMVDECSLEPANCTEILDQVLRLMEFRVKKVGATLVRKIEPGLPGIRTDAEAVQHVLLNLISNALDAVKDSEDKTIAVEMVQKDRFLQITVADAGKGILPEHISRIFDPFFTTKSVGQGTGLGLSVCRNLVEALDGHIICESEPGHGARFMVTLPFNAGQ